MSKKKQAHHITNTSELLLIIMNAGVGCFILGMNIAAQGANILMYVLSAWLFGVALYLLVSRIRRIQGDQRFDRSLHGDLDHAISMATYQVRLSTLGRWSILPVAILILLAVWEKGKSVWVMLAVLILFAFAGYASGWEHRFYKSRKRELEILKGKLEKES
jgi:hypothetical protein